MNSVKKTYIVFTIGSFSVLGWLNNFKLKFGGMYNMHATFLHIFPIIQYGFESSNLTKDKLNL